MFKDVYKKIFKKNSKIFKKNNCLKIYAMKKIIKYNTISKPNNAQFKNNILPISIN